MSEQNDGCRVELKLGGYNLTLTTNVSFRIIVGTSVTVLLIYVARGLYDKVSFAL